MTVPGQQDSRPTRAAMSAEYRRELSVGIANAYRAIASCLADPMHTDEDLRQAQKNMSASIQHVAALLDEAVDLKAVEGALGLEAIKS